MEDLFLIMRSRTVSLLITGSPGKTMQKQFTLKLAGQSGRVLLSNTGEEEAGTREISGKGTITLGSCEAAVILL